MHRTPVPAILIVLIAGSLALAPPFVLAQAADGDASGILTVRGVVRDDAGHPLANIEVTGNSWSDEGGESFDSDHTDANGSYEIQLAPGKAQVSAWSRALNRGDSQAVDLQAGNDTVVDLTIVRPPPKDAIVEGTVFGSDGKPVEGARVTIGQGCCYAYAETSPAYAGDGGGDEGNATNESNATNETATTTAALKPAEEPMQEPGEGASGDARIMPMPCCYDHDHQETVTAADGTYRFETYGGPRRITAVAEGYAQTSIDVQAEAGKTVEADLRLEKVPDADAELKGTVVDAETGLPVPNAHVWMSNLEWGAWNSTTTGPDGTFTFLTIPGWVQISISANRGCCEPVPLAADGEPVTDVAVDHAKRPASPARDYRNTILAFDLESGETDRTFELVPKPEPSIVLTGYVVDPNTQKGVEGAWVNFWNQDTGDWGQAQTDATGSYKMTVRPGYHQVTAWRDGYLSGAGTVMVEEGAGVQRHDVFMPKGTSKNVGCWDCRYYAEDAAVAEAGTAPATMPREAWAMDKGGADGDDTATGGARTTSTSPASSGGDGGEEGGAGEATYTGGGGGLPPYDPADADSTSAAQQDPGRDTAATPAPGLLALLGAAGAVALMARRRGTRRD